MIPSPFTAPDTSNAPFAVPDSFCLELPFPPSVNSIWKHGKNKRTGKPVIYLDHKYKVWRVEANAAYLQVKRSITPIKGNCTGIIILDETRRRSNTDGDNRGKVVWDFLQRMNLIENDAKLDDTQVKWGPVAGCFVKVFKA